MCFGFSEFERCFQWDGSQFMGSVYFETTPLSAMEMLRLTRDNQRVDGCFRIFNGGSGVSWRGGSNKNVTPKKGLKRCKKAFQLKTALTILSMIGFAPYFCFLLSISPPLVGHDRSYYDHCQPFFWPCTNGVPETAARCILASMIHLCVTLDTWSLAVQWGGEYPILGHQIIWTTIFSTMWWLGYPWISPCSDKPIV